jgi:UDP-N-acetyl-D-mannosaminuronic acid dehydrogenase
MTAPRLCVLGLGYIGLPTAAMLASRGHAVLGCDTDARVVAAVQAGRPHFREPDLAMLLAAAVQTGRLTAATAPAEADAFLIAVPTPFAAGHQPDLSHVEAALAAVAPLLRPGNLVVLESTVPVGTTEALARRLAALRPDLAIPQRGEAAPPGAVHLAHCPERVLPGAMLRELVANDRIIGGLTEACAERARALYESFATGALHVTDCRTAEFVKLAENAFRDVNIAFANELAALCERLELDPWAAIALANRHPRVSILNPGAGVGGHCIAVDPWFLVAAAPEEARLIRAARGVNDARPAQVAARIQALSSRFRAPVIGCFGLAYKADVEDLRESPALAVVEALAGAGLRLLVCEPFIQALPPSLAAQPHVSLATAEQARSGADIIAFLTPHRAFRRLSPHLFAEKAVVDAAGVLAQRG